MQGEARVHDRPSVLLRKEMIKRDAGIGFCDDGARRCAVLGMEYYLAGDCDYSLAHGNTLHGNCNIHGNTVHNDVNQTSLTVSMESLDL